MKDTEGWFLIDYIILDQKKKKQNSFNGKVFIKSCEEKEWFMVRSDSIILKQLYLGNYHIRGRKK